MSTFFATMDYNNRKVVCTDTQWENHIKDGHEIMSSNRDAVMETIYNPDKVYSSDSDSCREVFFKKTSLATYGKAFTTKVIVEYSDGQGELVTTFPTKGEKGGISYVIYPI